ncbi:TlpA family protein disulfide reductase [Mucilaginibacter flavidus]|uniref:TlpA family protein disulfide reductase n=1 Tax=Mucilaginibacter flavidus TaxID=2949309 RepID=UPI0020940273|nr:TlpA disulfide reductase family protein [Mucilaginibacter flavidus]MCO5946011.1 TlpA family protein disulfide reductase [Mucilaginibacter flavidus]
MKTLLSIIAFFFTVHFTTAQTTLHGKPIGDPAKILKDGMSLAYYNRDYLKTSEDFKAYNTSGQPINKNEFFRQFATGNYLPMRLHSKSGNYYQLYKLAPSVSEDVHSVLQSYGQNGYKHFKMEGKRLPGLNYTDINGEVYKSHNTKGKIVVIKCWFLHCQACNEEIPALNNLVDQYKNRKDIVFVSLAFDPVDKLKAYMKTHVFKYALAHVPESYIEKQLGTNEYPTHYVVDKNGLIAKVVNNADELTVALKTEAAK